MDDRERRRPGPRRRGELARVPVGGAAARGPRVMGARRLGGVRWVVIAAAAVLATILAPAAGAQPLVPPLVDVVQDEVALADGVAVERSLLVVDDGAEVVVTNGSAATVTAALALHELARADDGVVGAGAVLDPTVRTSLLAADRLVLPPRGRARLVVPLPADREHVVLRLDGDDLAAPLDVVVLRAQPTPGLVLDVDLADDEPVVTLRAQRPVVARLVTRVQAATGARTDTDHGLVVVLPDEARRVVLPATPLALGRLDVSAAATVLAADDADGPSVTAAASRTVVGRAAVLGVAAVALTGLTVAGVLLAQRRRREPAASAIDVDGSPNGGAGDP